MVLSRTMEKRKESCGSYAIKRVAAGAHLSHLWLFEPAKRPDDSADLLPGLEKMGKMNCSRIEYIDFSSQ